MKVNELIEKLQALVDKDVPVFVEVKVGKDFAMSESKGVDYDNTGEAFPHPFVVIF